MNRERILRASAVLIAIAAFFDPTFTRAADHRPTVVVLNAATADRDQAQDVVTTLQPDFDVSRVDIPGAAAYVITGSDLPDGWRPPAGARVFSVSSPGAALKVLQFNAPGAASVDSIVPLDVELQVDGSGDREATISLFADGVRFSSAPHRVTGDATRLRAPLTFVPTHPGLVRLRVEVTMYGRISAVADRVVEVSERVWKILAFDGRPSYAGTFVRRALESDSRFQVTTRVVTSRSSAIESKPTQATSASPATLADFASLSTFDAIVVAAAEGLGEIEASALQQYMRDRHGAVVLLPESAEGALLSRLTGQSTWLEDLRAEPVQVTPAASAGLGGNEVWTAAEFLWPSRWPALTETIAIVSDQPTASPRPAVWQVPVGSGRLAVSSAVDGWRSRAGSASGFAAFWRTTIAALAQLTPPSIDVTVSPRLLRAGQWGRVTVGLQSEATPAAQIKPVGGPSPREPAVRLWPATTAATSREWTGAFRAPEAPGRYQLQVDTGPDVAVNTEFMVLAADGTDAPVRPALERDGLATLAAGAYGGTVVPANEIPRLPGLITSTSTGNREREPWHPMRSAWWLLPFTLCVSAEWWLRRHRGER